ncbi:PqiC family protein [Thiocapsa sp.]|uniref:PqiC family protein n=1 Tax=Thiocapsa sp. TaxID=2024551 RepID=UPI0025FCB84D|nr:PqiC family protein [Thiocapsa sp.]
MKVRGIWLALAVAFAVLVTTGCATSPPSSFYTLTPMRAMPDSGGAPSSGLSVGLGPVNFPQFLDRPQIVTRDAGNRLAIDEFHRWGGTIQDDFLRVWIENMSALLGTTSVFAFPNEVRYPLDFRVTADVLAFEGTSDGYAVLRARWIVLEHRTDQVLRVEETHYRRPLAEPKDEGALIAAMSETLGDFSRDVAVTLRQLPKPKPPPPEGPEDRDGVLRIP